MLIKKEFKDMLFVKRKRETASTIDHADFDHMENFICKKFEGMYTIKNINPETSDDLFYIDFRNTLPGYVESSGADYINLVDGKNKLVRSFCNSFYHSVMDDISDIIYAMSIYPNHELILDISDIQYGIGGLESYWNIFDFFIETLNMKKIKYKMVALKNYDIVYMDNFILVEFIYESGHKANFVHEFFKDRVSNKNIEPFRNVYVSRRKREELSSKVEIDEAKGMFFNKDERIDDHESIEKYFIDLGYEIVYSEKFKSFQDQLDYFYETKTIASLSGSGLTNAVFMQPGGTLIEIVSPLVTTVPPPYGPKDITNPFYVQEVHNFYKMVAFYMNHYYLAVQNLSRRFTELKDSIENNQDLKRFISRDEKKDNNI